jgi:uncharacterized phage-like protein YoqJ
MAESRVFFVGGRIADTDLNRAQMIPKFDKSRSVAFLGAENSTDLTTLDMDLQGKLFELLSLLYKGGYRYFYSALFEGFDLIAAEMVAMLKMRGAHDEIKLITVITTEGQASDYSPHNSVQFADLFARADHRTVIGMSFTGGRLAIEDEFIDASALVVCWDDGEDDELTFALGKAEDKGLQILNVKEIQSEDK